MLETIQYETDKHRDTVELGREGSIIFEAQSNNSNNFDSSEESLDLRNFERIMDRSQSNRDKIKEIFLDKEYEKEDIKKEYLAESQETC